MVSTKCSLVTKVRSVLMCNQSVTNKARKSKKKVAIANQNDLYDGVSVTGTYKGKKFLEIFVDSVGKYVPDLNAAKKCTV